VDPVFRPACPSDSDEVVPLIYLSGQIPSGGNLFDILFVLNKEQVLDLLNKLFVAKTPSWLHHSVFYVAEIENQVGAVACAYLEPEHGIESMIAALIECGWKKDDFAAFRQVGSVFNHVRPKAEKDVWIVEFVATHPQHRRRGLVQILIYILLRKGKNRGLKKAQIGFFSENVIARKTYEKSGFQDETTRKNPEFTELFKSDSFTTLFRNL